MAKKKAAPSLYTLDKLEKMWLHEELTLEQVIGQIILWLQNFLNRFASMETRQLNFEQRLRALEKQQQ